MWASLVWNFNYFYLILYKLSLPMLIEQVQTLFLPSRVIEVTSSQRGQSLTKILKLKSLIKEFIHRGGSSKVQYHITKWKIVLKIHMSNSRQSDKLKRGWPILRWDFKGIVLKDFLKYKGQLWVLIIKMCYER